MDNKKYTVLLSGGQGRGRLTAQVEAVKQAILNSGCKDIIFTIQDWKTINEIKEQVKSELIKELREWIVINRLISYDTTDTERLLAKLDLLEKGGDTNSIYF
jgi:hypothetical protein